jgi:tetratricopeptide (TPR) repeat protein
MGTKFFLSDFYIAWAGALLLDGRAQEANRAGDRALELAIAFGERGNQAWALQALSEIAVSQESADVESAAASSERGRALAEELGLRPLLARCHLDLGRLYQRMGRRQQAEESLGVASAMFSEMDMRFWLEQAESALKRLD